MPAVRLSRQSVRSRGSGTEFLRTDHPLPRLQGTVRCGDAAKSAGGSGAVGNPCRRVLGQGSEPAPLERAACVSSRPESHASKGGEALQMAAFQYPVSGVGCSPGTKLERAGPLPEVWCFPGEERPAVSAVGLRRNEGPRPSRGQRVISARNTPPREGSLAARGRCAGWESRRGYACGRSGSTGTGCTSRVGEGLG